MASRGGVTWESRQLLNTLGTFEARMDRAITAAIGLHATKAVAFARRGAPWTDRTGNARNGLFATAERDRPRYRIVIGHSVSYGIWLEVAHSGKYRIIVPTIDHEGPELMKTVAGLYGRIFRGGA